jgi:uncharacterized delta-60 repeat protein
VRVRAAAGGLLALAAALGSGARADSGALDTAWGAGGAVRVALEPAFDKATPFVFVAALARVRGRFVVAGATGEAGDYVGEPKAVLLRVSGAGRLDRALNGTGVRRFALGSTAVHAVDTLVLRDGGLLYGGRGLLRADREGRVVRSFGRRGTMQAVFGGCRYHLWPLLEQADGRVVSGAVSCGSPPRDPGGLKRDGVWELVRTLPNGRLDSSFGRGGLVALRVGPDAKAYRSAPDDAAAVAQLADGTLVVAGCAEAPDGRQAFAVIRLDASGALDRSFGNAGVALQPVDDRYGLDGFGDLLVRPDGRALVSATAFSHTYVAAFAADGQPDTTWRGGLGEYAQQGVPPAGSFDGGRLVLRPDGIVFWLHSTRLTALREDGSLDPSFGQRGVLRLGNGAGTRELTRMLLLPDRRILLGGTVALPRQRWGIALFRYRY